MGTAIVVGALIVITFAIIRSMIKSKKAGRMISCGMDCSKCNGGCSGTK